MFSLIISKLQEEVLGKILIHRYLTRFGNSFISGFTAVYAYSISGNQIWVPVCIYLFARFLTIIFLFFSDFIFNVLKTRLSIILGIFFGIGTWITLIFTNKDTWTITFPIFSIILSLNLALYWSTYNNIFNLSLTNKNRSQIFAFNRNFSNILGIFMPAIVGFVVSFYSFNLAFAIGLFFILLSLYPILKLPKQKNIYFSWNRKDIFNNLIAKKNFKFVFTIFFQGFERPFLTILWPVVVYILLDGDLLSFGIVASAASFFVIILNALVGKYSDKFQKGPFFLKISSSLQSIIYIFKIFAQTISDILLLRSFSQVSSSIVNLSADSIVFQEASKEKSLSDEYLVLREISSSFGRIAGLSFILILSNFFALQTLFLCAAISVLFINILTFKKK